MADNLEDGEFWLPPQFLTDDDDFTSSDPDSSSLTSSSDDDDSLSLLTRTISPSPTPLSLLTSSKRWGVVLSTSPKSTLCGCVGKDDSTLPTPNLLFSPPEEAAETLNLLNKAAGEVARVKVSRATPSVSGTGFFDCRSKLPSSPLPTKINNSNTTYTHFNSHPPFPQQLAWGKMKPANGLLGLPPNAWPPLKPHNHRHAMPAAAMFVTNPPLIRECVGTGVFLPRAVPSTTPPLETRKKTEATGKKKKNGKGQSQQRKNSPSLTANENEIRLPQEWTY